jgi:hypothetical protein
MTIRQLMLELSKFDGQLNVMLVANKPATRIPIDAVEETDREREAHLAVLPNEYLCARQSQKPPITQQT